MRRRITLCKDAHKKLISKYSFSDKIFAKELYTIKKQQQQPFIND